MHARHHQAARVLAGPLALGSGALAATGSDDPSHVARGRTWLTCAHHRPPPTKIWQPSNAEVGQPHRGRDNQVCQHNDPHRRRQAWS
jgi:hypothetical protein